MKKIYLFMVFAFLLMMLKVNPLSAQPTNTIDSLALVDLYNSTNGTAWNNHTNWLTGPVPTWYGIVVTNSHVRLIKMIANNLSGPLPSSIGNLTMLDSLILWSNDLTGEIPSTIGNLKNLQVLRLFTNRLSGSIPSSIGTMTKLRALELNGNRLTGTLPSSLGNLPDIRVMSVAQCNLTGQIPASFAKLKKLQKLYLNLNHFTQNGNAYLNVPPSPCEVDLRGNEFNFDGIEFVAATFINSRYEMQSLKTRIHNNNNVLSVYAGGTLSNNTYRWIRQVGAQMDTTTIVGDSVFVPQQSGIYLVSVTNSIATDLVVTSSSINVNLHLLASANAQANALAGKLKVFPNPATNKIFINSDSKIDINIINSSGKKIMMKEAVKTTEIDVSKLPAGIYYVVDKKSGAKTKFIITK